MSSNPVKRRTIKERILDGIKKDKKYIDIAEELGISRWTVKKEVFKMQSARAHLQIRQPTKARRGDGDNSLKNTLRGNPPTFNRRKEPKRNNGFLRLYRVPHEW